MKSYTVRTALWLAAAAACLAVRVDLENDMTVRPTIVRERRAAGKVPPQFPDVYTATYTFTLPYTKVFLPRPVSYPVRLWVDRPNKDIRMSTYDGLDTELDSKGNVYMITPRLNDTICRVSRSLPSELDKGAHSSPSLLQGGLPSMEDWEFDSEVTYEGRPAVKWTYVHKTELKISEYYFILTDSGEPLYLHMMGSELFTGAHFDEYEIKFTSYQPSLDEQGVFDVPEICQGDNVEFVGSDVIRPMSIHFAALLPDVHLSRSEYDDFAELHGRKHANVTERHVRGALYLHHSAIIRQHNLRPNATFYMAANKFADWTNDEYKMLLGLRRASSGSTDPSQQKHMESVVQQGRKLTRKFKPTPGWMPLPTTVDWRGSGAVGVVKDQGVCGSCWAFSASQAMSAAWWHATGDYVSLSEQQIMDCSWQYGYNHACDGGDPDLAIQYIADHGGAYAEKDWAYRGDDNYCKTDRNQTELAINPKAFFNEVVYIEEYDERAVQEALYRYGPLSIGVDANPTDFRFYSSGVLWSDSCKRDPDSLDHAILLVGYGEEYGQPYWLVKNEWSAHWGDGGFMKINRKHDCGVSTQVVFPVANPEKVKAAMAGKL